MYKLRIGMLYTVDARVMTTGFTHSTDQLHDGLLELSTRVRDHLEEHEQEDPVG